MPPMLERGTKVVKKFFLITFIYLFTEINWRGNDERAQQLARGSYHSSLLLLYRQHLLVKTRRRKRSTTLPHFQYFWSRGYARYHHWIIIDGINCPICIDNWFIMWLKLVITGSMDLNWYQGPIHVGLGGYLAAKSQNQNITLVKLKRKNWNFQETWSN